MTNRQCPDGWDYVPNGNDGKCMKFYLGELYPGWVQLASYLTGKLILGGESHLPWYDGFHYCKSIGAQMIMIENEMEQKFVAQESVFIMAFLRTLLAKAKPNIILQNLQ